MSILKLLGTSSCEGIPAPFCRCELCTLARREGGKNRRRRFSVLIDNHILIDFGPDAAWQFEAFKVDETLIDTICITHSHIDHLDALDMLWSSAYDTAEISLIANEAAQNKVKDTFYNAGITGNTGAFKLITPEPGVSVLSGNAEILPVRATHCDDMECALNYLITTREGKKIFILSDTGWWREQSFEYVRGANADAAVIEMSYGIHAPYDTEQRQHLGAAAAIKFLDKLKADGALKPDAVCVTAHISHCSKTTHGELENFFAGKGIAPGYDGMTLSF